MKRKDQRSMLMLAIIMAFVVGFFWAGPVGAGDLEPPADAVDVDENPVSTMCTLQEICDKLDSMDEKRVGAPVGKTGQTTSHATEDDGDLEKGVVWPNPRFTDNNDGTVTDNLTGLIWLKDANCAETKRCWLTAISFAAALQAGDCGLSDSSSAGDWRLPNVKELQSLIHYGFSCPTLPDTAGTGQWSEGDPFTGEVLRSGNFWSSTTWFAYGTSDAWFVYFREGSVNESSKSADLYVWPVRGGQ